MTNESKNKSTELAEEICRDWGWTLEELMETLENGGSSLHPMKNISATQTAHVIIKNLLKNAK